MQTNHPSGPEISPPVRGAVKLECACVAEHELSSSRMTNEYRG
jgi:hypothetical protein